MYKTMYPSYLIHYNKNHSKKNGQFVSGDGDGDGISNDHANQFKPKGEKKGKYRLSECTYTNRKGQKLRYVSPNNLMRTGYWVDEDTGKKAGLGTQLFKKTPQELRAREFGKSMFQMGVYDTAATIIRLGAKYTEKAILNASEKRSAAERATVEDAYRASKAKFAGGDW